MLKLKLLDRTRPNAYEIPSINIALVIARAIKRDQALDNGQSPATIKVGKVMLVKTEQRKLAEIHWFLAVERIHGMPAFIKAIKAHRRAMADRIEREKQARRNS